MFSASYASLPPLPHRIFLLLTVIWAGSLWTVGYMVAPTLFSILPSRETAGMVAGQLFYTEAVLGVVVGVLQLVLCNVMIRRGAVRYRALRWLVLAMLCCVLAGYFGVQPFMEALKAKAHALGVGVSESPYRGDFGMLHGISSGFYLLQSVLALVLVWRAAAPRSAGE
ncbi:hypothetical protein BKK79_17870 [Cupriavidus sp. USMAA2-4]|uniref:TMEM205-like domain-containing protein n=1 Tax=Cupriavidus malaysiensis TaxID=367825 RepID=A0ABN4TIJ9_9BURK|nr:MULTISPECIES: DUF4149 domain-containing protein [Cupriavidus]AOY93455.1 hypothetical protein BKK79_17870 [Cupriavidus sp. USMAA2-4]AOZ00267.1 hypothetical protein BKK81_14200 [Cupriavidus sp. USMAHM13]AOZ07012.1 hypothetical protein BKK80_15135 [Cupriavidus malaysiensis]